MILEMALLLPLSQIFSVNLIEFLGKKLNLHYMMTIHQHVVNYGCVQLYMYSGLSSNRRVWNKGTGQQYFSKAQSCHCILFTTME